MVDDLFLVSFSAIGLIAGVFWMRSRELVWGALFILSAGPAARIVANVYVTEGWPNRTLDALSIAALVCGALMVIPMAWKRFSTQAVRCGATGGSAWWFPVGLLAVRS